MDILEKSNIEMNFEDSNNKDWLNLPNLADIKEVTNKRLIERNDSPEVCSYILWNRVEREVLFTLPIPPGFVRNEEEFGLKIEADKSYLKIVDEVVRKAAEIKIVGDDGNIVDMECSIDIIRKCMKGEIIFNLLGKGFKSKAAVKIDEVRRGTPVNETAFTNKQTVVISNTLGYTCKDCKKNDKEEIAVTITKGKPFITLPDGSKVDDKVEFDKLLTGDINMLINVPCSILVELIIEPIL